MGKNDNKEAIEKLRKKIRRLQGKEQHLQKNLQKCQVSCRRNF